jgi:hypothetical protein
LGGRANLYSHLKAVRGGRVNGWEVAELIVWG